MKGSDVIPRRKTNQEFIQEVKQLVDDEYIFLEEYRNNSTPILCRHNKCNHEWKIKPNNFVQNGTRCPKCCCSQVVRSLSKKEKLHKRIKDLGYSIVKDYVNNKTPMVLIHNSCKHEFSMTPDVIMISKCPCSKCNTNLTLGKKEYIKNNISEIIIEHDKDYKFCNYIEPNKGYVNICTKFMVKHITCNREFPTNYSNFIKNGNRCPYCNMEKTKSKGVTLIENYLNEYNINFISEFYIKEDESLKNKPYDFYLPDYNTLIEFQGSQHYMKKFNMNDEDLVRRQEIDNLKLKIAEKLDYNYLEISYMEVNDISYIMDEFLKEVETSTTIETTYV